MAAQDFPSIHDFPPLYTRQINTETWQKQLQVWCDLILNYCRVNKIFNLDLTEALNWPLFNNSKIQRKINLDLAQAILDQLVAQGNAQWEGTTKTRCLIIWRTPEQWANLIYEWVNERGMNNTVVTLYELQHGEDTQDTAFHQLDSVMLMKALEALQKKGKAQIFQVDSDSGVKFF